MQGMEYHALHFFHTHPKPVSEGVLNAGVARNPTFRISSFGFGHSFGDSGFVIVSSFGFGHFIAVHPQLKSE